MAFNPGTGAWSPDTLLNTPATYTSTDRGGSRQQANPVAQTLLAQAPQSQVKPWTAPKLVNGNQFQSQADVDAFKGALHPSSFGWNAGGEHATGAGDILSPTGRANADAAMAWGQAQGIIPKASGSSGLPGLSSFKDFMQNWAPIIAVAAPAIGGVAFGAGAGAGGSAATGLGNGAVAGGSVGAGSVAGATGVAAAGSGVSDLVAEHMIATGAAGGVPATAGLSAGVAGAPAAAAAIPGADSATQDLIAQHAVQTGGQLAPSAPSTLLGSAPSAAISAAPAADVINTNAGQAADPTAAPASELPPPSISPGSVQGPGGTTGAGASPSAAPSVASNGDLLGKVTTFSRDALTLGGLLGGLAGLQSGKSPASPEQPPPAPEATANNIPTQASAKNDLSKGAAPGGPNAGIDTTWLTGMGGVPDDQLRLGRSTLLGQ